MRAPIIVTMIGTTIPNKPNERPTSISAVHAPRRPQRVVDRIVEIGILAADAVQRAVNAAPVEVVEDHRTPPERFRQRAAAGRKSTARSRRRSALRRPLPIWIGSMPCQCSFIDTKVTISFPFMQRRRRKPCGATVRRRPRRRRSGSRIRDDAPPPHAGRGRRAAGPCGAPRQAQDR